MKINLRSKKGFTTVDLSIAMIVIMIFVVIMTSISNSVYSASMEAKRTAVALNYAVDIFEHIGAVDVSEVVPSSDLLEISSLQGFNCQTASTVNGIGVITGKIGTYEIRLEIEDYANDGIVKIITLRITYPVSKKKTETLELQRIKAREKTSAGGM